MSLLIWFVPLYSPFGFCVGTLFGMTGIGGGSFMTPTHIVLFGIHSGTATGANRVYLSTTQAGRADREALGASQACEGTLALLRQAWHTRLSRRVQNLAQCGACPLC